MAEKLVSGDRCTARAACRHFGLNRSTYAYRAKEADAWEAKLKGALRRKSNEHPELGYAKITRLLKQEGWQVGARNVQRLRRELSGNLLAIELGPRWGGLDRVDRANSCDIRYFDGFLFFQAADISSL
jgi:hypothetical protein